VQVDLLKVYQTDDWVGKNKKNIAGLHVYKVGIALRIDQWLVASQFDYNKTGNYMIVCVYTHATIHVITKHVG
jgi:hypothetical protein